MQQTTVRVFVLIMDYSIAVLQSNHLTAVFSSNIAFFCFLSIHSCIWGIIFKGYSIRARSCIKQAPRRMAERSHGLYCCLVVYGATVGAAVGAAVGTEVGTAVGVGVAVGAVVGVAVGFAVGVAVGTAVGTGVGVPLGFGVGVPVGVGVGVVLTMVTYLAKT